MLKILRTSELIAEQAVIIIRFNLGIMHFSLVSIQLKKGLDFFQLEKSIQQQKAEISLGSGLNGI